MSSSCAKLKKAGNGDAAPRDIRNIDAIGWINGQFNLGLLRKTRQTGGKATFEFEIGGKKYDAWSSLNSDDGKANARNLKQHHSYVIQGTIKAGGKSSKYDKASSSTSRYKIFLGKINILQETAGSSSMDKVVTLASLQRDFKSKKYGTFEMKNLTITAGELYRYWGCERCHKKLSDPPNPKGKYICSQCKVKVGVNGRICAIARNIEVEDDQNGKLYDLVIYHDEVGKILGKDALKVICSSFSDTKAKKGFKKLIGGTFHGDIEHRKPPSGSPFKSPMVILKKIRWLSPINKIPKSNRDRYSDVDDDDDSAEASHDLKPRSRTDGPKNFNIICKNCKESEDMEIKEGDGDGSDSDNGHQNAIIPIPDTSATDEIANRLRVIRLKQAYKLAGQGEAKRHFGLALIININSIKGQDPRTGSQKDVKALEEVFPQLNIDIFRDKTIQNPELKDFPELLQKFKSQLIKDDYGSSFVVYMGHGQHNYVKLGDGERINVYENIMWMFAEEKFGGFRQKPKIFIFEACQGVKEGPKGFTLPDTSPMAHMLWVTPCLPGQLAKRGRRPGSYFIRTLVKSLKKYKTLELTEILKKMQEDMERNPLENDDKKKIFLIPNFMPRLFGQYFFPC